MTINLRILVPEAITNYIKNPQFRYDTAGWNSSAGETITRSLDRARFGIASGKVVTDGSAINEGVNYRVSWLNGFSDILTASVYVRGEAKLRVRLVDGLTQTYVSDTIRSVDDRWTRIVVPGRCSGGDDVRLYVETDDTVAKAVTFYVDGAQIERKEYATSYCDGDQPGCRWNIVNSNSVSTRLGDTRQGGRWIDLAGPCRGNNDLYVTVLGGMGHAPITNQIQPFALAPGGFYQGYKVNNRVVTWNFYAKQESQSPTPSINPLHELRQQLIDIIKPDKTVGGESFLLEYSDSEGDRPLYCNFRYEAGLEGEWDIRNGWFNSFPLRMIAVDPFWYEDNQNVQQLGIQTSYPSTTSTWKISGNKISNIGNVPSGQIECMVEGKDGIVYVGSRTSGGNRATVYKWDGSSFTAIGVADGASPIIIASLAVGPDGSLYASGGFTGFNGVAAVNIAKYNPSTGTWSPLGTGLTGYANSMIVANNGQLYIGGSITVAGGVTVYNIARWDGVQWRTVGATSGVNAQVNSIVQSKDQNVLYVGGEFTASNGGSITYRGVCSVNITTNLLSQVGYGLTMPTGTPTVLALAVGLDGTLYAGGDFTVSGSPGTTPLEHVAQWSGGNLWKPLANGLSGLTPATTGVVKSLVIGENGELIAGGNFVTSGTKEIRNGAIWNNNTWNHIQLYMGNILNQIWKLLETKSGDLYISSVAVAGIPSYYPNYNVVVNYGSNSVFPVLYIKGQGTVRYINNVKTGQAIYLNLPIFENEEVFINFAKGEIESTTRGNLLNTILPGSEIRSVNLLPGENEFGVLVTNDVNCVCQIRYTPQHWSADSIVDAEAL